MEKKNIRVLLIATIIVSALGAQSCMYAAQEDEREEDRKEYAVVDLEMNYNEVTEETPLMIAARDNKIDEVKALIAAGADITARYDKGYDALTEAAVVGNVEVVRLLLDAGAGVAARDRFGLCHNALEEAVWSTTSGSAQDKATQSDKVIPVIKVLIASGMNLTSDRVDNPRFPKQIQQLLKEAIIEREAGGQDWERQDLMEGKVLDQAASGTRAIEDLIADMTAHDLKGASYARQDLREALARRITEARERRLEAERAQEAAYDAEQGAEVSESVAAESGTENVVTCPECKTVQPDEGFFDCSQCGARI